MKDKGAKQCFGEQLTGFEEIDFFHFISISKHHVVGPMGVVHKIKI